jgi:hypothetical protein
MMRASHVVLKKNRPELTAIPGRKNSIPEEFATLESEDLVYSCKLVY